MVSRPRRIFLDVLATVDGNLIGGVIGNAINGFVARHPALTKPLTERTTHAGQAMLDRLRTECIGGGIFQQPFLCTSPLRGWLAKGQHIAVVLLL